MHLINLKYYPEINYQRQLKTNEPKQNNVLTFTSHQNNLDNVQKEWDNASAIWQQTRTQGDIYNELFTKPVFLKEVGPVKGLDFLDAGCGEGYYSRIFAKKGANVTGIDISARTIENAKAYLDPNLNINYQQGSITNLSAIADNSFDKAASVFVHIYLDLTNTQKSMNEMYRVLKPGGEYTFIVKHPSDFRPLKKERPFSPENLLYSRSYFSKKPYNHKLTVWDGTTPKKIDVKLYPKTASDYLQAAIDAGFDVETVKEPIVPDKLVQLDPAYHKFKYYPAMLVVKVKKPVTENL